MTRLPAHAALWLTIVRIYVGAYWLAHGLSKLLAGVPAAEPSWYHGPLAALLAQNAHTALPVLAAAEVLAGVLLVFGLFTRLAAFAAIVFAEGFLLTKGTYVTNYLELAGGAASVLMLAVLTFALSADFGVDGIRRYVRQRQEMRLERVEATPVDITWPE